MFRSWATARYQLQWCHRPVTSAFTRLMSEFTITILCGTCTGAVDGRRTHARQHNYQYQCGTASDRHGHAVSCAMNVPEKSQPLPMRPYTRSHVSRSPAVLVACILNVDVPPRVQPVQFGQQSLLHARVRLTAATVRTETPCMCLTLQDH